jgi:DNA-binding transcriptional ArsR family regulator
MLTSASRLDVMTRLGRAMSDPSRARILSALTGGPQYPAELADTLGMTRSNVSNHLACLRGCGLVAAEPQGRRTRYAIADPHLSQALASLVDVVLAVDEGEPCTSQTCDVPGCCAACEPVETHLLVATAATQVRA